MTVADFIRDLPDIPRIITALAEWLACLVCILPVRRREIAGGLEVCSDKRRISGGTVCLYGYYGWIRRGCMESVYGSGGASDVLLYTSMYGDDTE